MRVCSCLKTFDRTGGSWRLVRRASQSSCSALGALCATWLLAALLSGCGGKSLALSPVLTPEYNSYRRWTPASEVAPSADASAAASAMLARFTRHGQLTTDVRVGDTFGGSGTKMVPASKLRIVALIPEYRPRPGPQSRGIRDLEPTGQYDVVVSSGGATYGSFAMSHASGAWLYSADAEPGTSWSSDTWRINAAVRGPHSVALLVVSRPELAWYVGTTETGAFAFPSMHRERVWVAPDGSDNWQPVESRAYPVSVVFDRIR
jgi:hypothetical protein